MPTYAPDMPLRLAEAAFRLFSQRGIDKVSVDDVAKEARVTKGSVYWHYRSKNELILAACFHYFRNYHRRINDELAPVVDPMERLERTLRLAVRICLLDEPNRVFTMEIFTRSLYDAEVKRGWLQFYDGVREFYIGLVKAANQAGELTTADPEQAVNLMLAAMEGVKLRAMYEPHICCPQEEAHLREGLMEILGAARGRTVIRESRWMEGTRHTA